MFLVQEQARPRAPLTLEGDQGRPERTGASETKGDCRTAPPRAWGSPLPRPPSVSARTVPRPRLTFACLCGAACRALRVILVRTATPGGLTSPAPFPGEGPLTWAHPRVFVLPVYRTVSSQWKKLAVWGQLRCRASVLCSASLR